MKQKNFRSIRTKLIVVLTSIALLSILFLSATMLYRSYYQLREQSKISLKNTANILAQNLGATVEFDDAQSAQQLLETLKIDADIDAATIMKGDQKLFATFIANKKDEKRLVELFYSQKNIKKSTVFMDAQHIIVSTPIIDVEGKYLATFTIFGNTINLNKSLENQLFVTMIIALISSFLVILLAIKLQSIFTKPLFKLQVIMKEITDNSNYNVSFKNNYNDEFSTLFSGFSKMIHKIKEQNLKIESHLNDIRKQKEFVQTLLDSQEQLIVTTDGEKIVSANETFLDFYAVDSIENFMQEYDAKCICNTFNTEAPSGYLQTKMGNISWIDYILSDSLNSTDKVMITRGDTDFIFSVSAAKLPSKEKLYSAVFTNITEMEQAKTEIENIQKHTRESIEYASLIQGALIPERRLFRDHFSEYFTIWHPKDIVGGDIYLFEELRNKDECLLMVIDCTGHGVPGAFVTMLVKAIERQITAKINYDDDEDVSPAKILAIFNKNMKQLLKQEDIDSISNAGFDGAVVYYNKQDGVVKFAGAETPLFYVEDEELKAIKGDRYSVGYKKCDIKYEYKEHTIKVKEGMQFYLTTDGYLDQNGGEKGFPFGKKRFQNIINEYHNESMADQQELFLNFLDEYQNEEERNDDVTLVGFKI